jgi:hypothetical protein
MNDRTGKHSANGLRTHDRTPTMTGDRNDSTRAWARKLIYRCFCLLYAYTSLSIISSAFQAHVPGYVPVVRRLGPKRKGALYLIPMLVH